MSTIIKVDFERRIAIILAADSTKVERKTGDAAFEIKTQDDKESIVHLISDNYIRRSASRVRTRGHFSWQVYYAISKKMRLFSRRNLSVLPAIQFATMYLVLDHQKYQELCVSEGSVERGTQQSATNS